MPGAKSISSRDAPLRHGDQARDRDATDLHVDAGAQLEVDDRRAPGVDDRRLRDLGERIAAVLHAPLEPLTRGVELRDLEGLARVQRADRGDRSGRGQGVRRARRWAVGPAHGQRRDLGRRALADHDFDPRLARAALARVLAEQADAAYAGDRHHRDHLGLVVAVGPVQLADARRVDHQHRLAKRDLRPPDQPRMRADVEICEQLLFGESMHPVELNLRDVRFDPAHVLQARRAGREAQGAAEEQPLRAHTKHGSLCSRSSRTHPQGRMGGCSPARPRL
jgi:hypothetical protein